MTTAETISRQFHDRKTVWRDDGGRHLADVCQINSSRIFVETGTCFVRFEFRDGSAIVAGRIFWGIGLPGTGIDCTCWRGQNDEDHRANCSAVAEQARAGSVSASRDS